MSKIGIITMTSGQNYGNKLQNYAVQQVIKRLGHEPITIINTTRKGFDNPSFHWSKLKKFSPFYVVKVLKVRLKSNLYIKDDSDGIWESYIWKNRNQERIKIATQVRIQNFSRFFEMNIITSDFVISKDDNKKDLLSEFDYFFCGSDQIWNPYYPQNSMIDFLQFAPIEKRIAYAPSFGVDHIPVSKKEIYKKWINEIPHLSIREDKGAEIIKELTGRDAEVLVDPTLMLSAEEWLEIALKPDFEIPERYILTYFLGNQTRKYRRFIKVHANNLNCKIINLNEIREFEHFCVDPSGFLYLINKANLVCTDSFHGTVLSIILQRNFMVFDRVEDGNSMSSRIETLLKKFGLENMHYKHAAFHQSNDEINFQKIETIIQEERLKTVKYLRKALN